MKKSIGDLAVDKRKGNEERPPKLSARQKRNTIRQTKILQEEMGSFCVKRIEVTAGIPPSVSDETVSRVLEKAGIKRSYARNKGKLTKNNVKLRLKFAGKVSQELLKNFWTEGIRFYLDGGKFYK